ncbi:MAG: S41 family peptidase [Acidobacteriota bacterium]
MSRVLFGFLLTPLLWVMQLASPAAASAEESRWLRYPALSPDGETVVFSWRGDLWAVPAAGGEARALTTHEAYEAWPVWSRDSRHVAFASDRHGQLDVFVVPREGGAASRLTHHSADDYPTDFSVDGSRIYFTSNRQHAPKALLGSGRGFGELYSIATDGGTPRQELTTPAERARFSADGRWAVYEDVKAYENRWRKHHTSSAARDVWLWDQGDGSHSRLSTHSAEDRGPVFTPRGVAFTSERAGSLNVFLQALDEDGRGAGEPDQLTVHGPHPVRFLSAALDGTLAYGYHGEIYLLAPGGEPRRLEIDLRGGERANTVMRTTFTGEATEMAPSPHGDEVAFVVRGEVFVTSVKHGTTRRLTETPEQERSLTWAPDGRTLYFAGERGGAWNLYGLSLEIDSEERFFEATALEEKEVLTGVDETFQPVMSPDGERLAFLHNRDEIRLLDLETGEQTTLIGAERNYSYSDGDIEYIFSPDGRWLAASYYPFERWIPELGLIDLESGEVHNVTLSGYGEGAPLFTADGSALLFSSDRLGLRSHGSWGSESDIFALSLSRAAWDLARQSVEEFERQEDEKSPGKPGRQDDEDGEEDDEESAPARGAGGKEKPPLEPIDPIEVDTEDFETRTRRLTLHSAGLADFAASEDGEVIFMLARLDDRFDLYMARPRYGESRRLASLDDTQPGALEMSADGKTLFILTGRGSLRYLEVSGLLRSLRGGGPNGRGSGSGGRGGGGFGFQPSPKPIPFRAAMSVDTVAERLHLFEHAWRQAQKKFYVEDLHGADWPMLRQAYEGFVADLRHGRDFAELLSELLGELNASHTGGRYSGPQGEDRDRTASLGLLYDPDYEGPELRIAEVLKRGPADRAESRLEAGVLITHIDGRQLEAGVNLWSLLDRKQGQRVRLTARAVDGSSFDEVIKPIPSGAEGRLRYARWLERLRAKTEELSGGRVGYVHVEGMNDRSFRRFYQETLGRMSDKEALIIDTRYNGGGWLHDDLAAFLQGEDYLTVIPRGKEPGSFGHESFLRWTRPTAVLQNEANYSDAYIFPWVYNELDLGTLVGMPVAGTGTAVWWERLIDPSIVFGIPQVGMLDRRGVYMENNELKPDIEVRNDPESVARGEDKQLAAAVEALIEQLDRAAAGETGP